jgi:1-acyl-sn-glycerol-3-phosphate acyltransferase
MYLKINNRKINKYVLLIIKILLLVVVLIKFRKYYLKPLYNWIEYYYSSRIEVIGKENIPKKDGYVIISNHNFKTELLIIQNIIKNFDVVARKCMMAKFLSVNSRTIFYDNAENNIKNSGMIIKKIISTQCLDNKKNILVFPEGNYSNPTELLIFKKGLFYLCYEKNIPILPIIICVKKKYNFMYSICLDSKIKVKVFKMVYSNKFVTFDEYYDYIYNMMNNYFKKHVNNPNIEYNLLF